MRSRGFLMLDVIFATLIISLLTLVLLPNITNLYIAQEKIKQNEEMLNFAKNKMERAISQVYKGREIDIGSDDERYELKYNLSNYKNTKYLEVFVRERESEKEIKLDIYLSQPGLFTD